MTRRTHLGTVPAGRLAWSEHRPIVVEAELSHGRDDWRDDLNDPDQVISTIEHEQVKRGDVPHITVTWSYGTPAELRRGDGSGGAGIDSEVVAALPEPSRTRVRRIIELADRWHLNTTRAGCAHQGEAWTCSADGTVNGWHLSPKYPQRGDACTRCNRNRWDEPTDACPETGYRWGTSWLAEVPPAEVLAELTTLFYPAEVSA